MQSAMNLTRDSASSNIGATLKASGREEDTAMGGMAEEGVRGS